LFCLGLSISNAQISVYDSLLQILKHETNDSIKLRINVELSNECNEKDIPKYAETAVKLAQKLLDQKSISAKYRALFLNHLGSAYNDLGFYHRLNGNTTLAIDYYNKTLLIREQQNDSTGLVHALGNVAAVYNKTGNTKKAMELYSRCLTIQKYLKDNSGKAKTLFSIAIIYNNQGLDKEISLDYLNQSLAIYREINDKSTEAKVLNQIGTLYKSLGKYNKALDCFRNCIKLQSETGENNQTSYSFASIASIYFDEGNIDSAMIIYNKGLDIAKKVGDEENISHIYIELGNLNYNINKLALSEKYAQSGLSIAKQVGYPKYIKKAAELLYKIYKKQNNPKKALQMHELFVLMRDSIFNTDTKSSILKSQLKYEFEKKAFADSLNNLSEKKLINSKLELEHSKLKLQQLFSIVLLTVLIILIVLALVIYKNYKRKKMLASALQIQKDEISSQKNTIEFKSKQINESIDYASRIQDSFIQSETAIKELGKEYFIFNKPKDIVGGDFIWAKLRGNHFMFAVVDCTGHGVPGAFMSLVGYNLLEQAVQSLGKVQPKEILHWVNTNIKAVLKPKGNETSYEGMDIIISDLDLSTNVLRFSGAKQRLCVNSNTQIKTYRTDNYTIGTSPDYVFSQQQVRLTKGDVVYLFTDGYPDQKGGEKRRKLYYENFEKLLTMNDNESLLQKKAFLNDHLLSWQSNEEQIDDILVVGIRI